MSDQPAARSNPAELPQVSARWVRMGLRYVPRLVRKHFSAVRLLGGLPDELTQGSGEPLLIYMNHPSWWDPVAVAVLTERFFRGRTGYGPIDGKGLEKYRFMEKLGFFGIDPNSRAGAAKFLKVGRAVLETPGAILWVTAEGHFTDPRLRPVRLRPGVAHLVRKAKRVTVLPLAIEYPFGEEKQPEMRLAFGEPIVVTPPRTTSSEADASAKDPGRTSAQWNALLERRLTETMDRLAAATIEQEVEAFTLLSDGKRGVGGVYDVWRRLKAWATGKKFDPAHGAEAGRGV
ncbi:MAG: lysophospholipid acyltransferase family protein [Planctomycetota bacterium]